MWRRSPRPGASSRSAAPTHRRCGVRHGAAGHRRARRSGQRSILRMPPGTGPVPRPPRSGAPPLTARLGWLGGSNAHVVVGRCADAGHAPRSPRPSPRRARRHRPGARPRCGPLRRPRRPAPAPVAAAGTALVVATSGSSGTPRRVLLSGDALRASAERSQARLGGPGRWLLGPPSPPCRGPAGAAALHRRGRAPARGHRALALASAARRRSTTRAPPHGCTPRSCPPRLTRIVTAAEGVPPGAELAPLREDFDAILVGGAGTAPASWAAGVTSACAS